MFFLPPMILIIGKGRGNEGEKYVRNEIVQTPYINTVRYCLPHKTITTYNNYVNKVSNFNSVRPYNP